jgi:hypothetical protein
VCVLELWCIVYVQYVFWIQTCEGNKNHHPIGILKKQRPKDLLVQQFRFVLREKIVQNLEVPEESLVQVSWLLRYTECNIGDILYFGVIGDYV